MKIKDIRLVETSPGLFTYMGWVDPIVNRYKATKKLREIAKSQLERLLGYKILMSDEYEDVLLRKYESDRSK